jgi:hypothetical protein
MAVDARNRAASDRSDAAENRRDSGADQRSAADTATNVSLA